MLFFFTRGRSSRSGPRIYPNPYLPFTQRLPRLTAPPLFPSIMITESSFTYMLIAQPVLHEPQVLSTRFMPQYRVLYRASFSTRAPTGHTWIHSPQNTHADSMSGLSPFVTIFA